MTFRRPRECYRQAHWYLKHVPRYCRCFALPASASILWVGFEVLCLVCRSRGAGARAAKSNGLGLSGRLQQGRRTFWVHYLDTPCMSRNRCKRLSAVLAPALVHNDQVLSGEKGDVIRWRAFPEAIAATWDIPRQQPPSCRHSVMDVLAGFNMGGLLVGG